MQHTRYVSIVRASAWYDLLVTWRFATPWSFVWLYSSLAAEDLFPKRSRRIPLSLLVLIARVSEVSEHAPRSWSRCDAYS